MRRSPTDQIDRTELAFRQNICRKRPNQTSPHRERGFVWFRTRPTGVCEVDNLSLVDESKDNLPDSSAAALGEFGDEL